MDLMAWFVEFWQIRDMIIGVLFYSNSLRAKSGHFLRGIATRYYGSEELNGTAIVGPIHFEFDSDWKNGSPKTFKNFWMIHKYCTTNIQAWGCCMGSRALGLAWGKPLRPSRGWVERRPMAMTPWEHVAVFFGIRNKLGYRKPYLYKVVFSLLSLFRSCCSKPDSRIWHLPWTIIIQS